MLSPTRILETSLYVDDLDRAASFYKNVLGLCELYADNRLVAFDVAGVSVLLLFLRGGSLTTVHLPGGSIPPHDGAGPYHFAFAINAEELPAWEARLKAHGIDIEARTVWPRGGTSLYFRDPDRHMVELATPGLWATY
jgi:catechol 2,3-dioxygenase-like lactoylglutathione lyase family enzyme